MAVGTTLYIAQSFGSVVKTKNAKGEVVRTFSFDNQTGIFTGLDSTHGYIFNNKLDGKQYAIYQLGIQTLPGVRVRLGENNVGTQGADIRIGQTGIFEINLSEKLPIDTSIQFVNLTNMLLTDEGNNNNYCLIDVIYSELQGGESSS